MVQTLSAYQDVQTLEAVAGQPGQTLAMGPVASQLAIKMIGTNGGGFFNARIEAGTRRPDLLVIDLGLPDGDGVDLIRELRQWSAAPVIVLSARSGEDDKIAALDAGADDYLAKPFGAGELLARIRAQLRRHLQHTTSGAALVEFGATRVDLVRRLVEHSGVPLHLTPIEHKLLTCLATQPDRVLTHQQLLKAVWGPGHAQDTHYVRVHMANLRKKIEADPSMPKHLLTEAGIGYRFVA